MVLQRSSTAAVASSRALPCSRAPRSNSMPAASETIKKRNEESTHEKDKKNKKVKAKILTRNSLGSRHELASHLSFTRSRSCGKLLLAVRGLPLQALLSLGCSSQLQLETILRTKGDLGLLLRLTKALLESINLTEGSVMLLCTQTIQASDNMT